MAKINIEIDELGVYNIHPFIMKDVRGTFTKYFSEIEMMEAGLYIDIKEVMCTTSKKGVVRGMHFQNIKEQGKLICVMKGRIYDVAVDLREDSPNYGKWKGYILTEERDLQIYIPRGFAHGYVCLEDAVVSYKVDENFYPEYDDGIYYADKDLNIDFDKYLEGKPAILSDKDKSLQSFIEYEEKIKRLRAEMKGAER